MNRSSYSQHVHPTVVKQQYDIQNVWAFENQWHSSLLSCKPMSRCCFACLCSCCMGCKLAKYLGETPIIGCFPCSLPYLRTKLRTARRIEGSCCGDCCSSDCCMACTATQIANELEAQGMWDVPRAKRGRIHRDDRSNQHEYN